MKKKYLLNSVILGFVASFMLNSNILAQERKEVLKKTEELPEVVVTATRTEIEVERAPASVNVVNREKIEKRSIKTLDDVVNEISGVYVHRTRVVIDTPTDAISIRGIPGYRRNLVMIDGIPLNDPQGGSLKWSGFRFEDIDRIEVVKGPFSALYGGLAMGGVVNIISTLPEKREFVVKTGYGSSFERGKSLDDLKKIYISYGDKIKNFRFFLSYGHESLNGFPSNLATVITKPPNYVSGWKYNTTPDGKSRWIVGDTGDHKGWDQNFTLRLGYELDRNTKIRFSTMKIWGSSSYDRPHTYLKDSLGNPVWNYFIPGIPPNILVEAMFLAGKIAKDYTIYSLNFETKVKKLKTKFILGLFDQDKYLFTTPCVGNVTACRPNEYATKESGPGKTHNTPAKGYILDLQFDLPLLINLSYFKHHLLTFGFSYKRGEAKTKEYKITNWKKEGSKTSLLYETKGKDKIFGLFIQDELPLSEKFTLYLGARYDWWKTFDGYENNIGEIGYPKKYKARSSSSFSPKFSFIYKISEKTSFRGSIGSAFRPPMLIELYRSYMTPISFFYGNPKLKPEKSISWDLGIRHSFWGGNKVEISYFENYLKDLIYTRRTGKYIGFREMVESLNIGKARIKGVEISLEQQLGKSVRTFANLTWNDAKVKKNPANPETEGKRITYIPETMFNIGIEYERGPFSLSLIGRYRSKVYGKDDNSDKKEGVFGSYDSYFIANTKLSYKILKNAKLSLNIDNLFDKKYYYYYLEPKRSYFLEFSYKF
ncbi:MAG: TonB-dependent receptor [Elusimicrobiota bacterium]|nr:TonB-dependent receptor [Endomicrobiia bacterium]MDW8166361.1 TonB-dependent receptor [Elusimicrobiota bacterium]